ncbi:MAG TPA: helical backbone metal receptor [bacterium]|nr:helical backbone metal receptor [bacterium]
MRKTVWFILFLLPAADVLFCEPENPAHRIVSLVPSGTQMIADLEFGSSLVGITEFCERPADATDAEVIGSQMAPNLERIARLQPTLVIADVESNKPTTVERIKDLGIPVVNLGPSRNRKDLENAFLTLADCLNVRQRADRKLQEWQKQLETVVKRLENHPKKRVFIEIWHRPLMTVSSKGFAHAIIEMAGGKNVFADSPVAYPIISMESVIARKPEVILILSEVSSLEERKATYSQFPLLSQCEMILIKSPQVTLPCFSSFVKSVDLISQRLHPDLMEQKP